MSYITDRLVAMSFPAQNISAIYRNPMWQVQQVLDMQHGPHYKVYNMCVEASYDPASFHDRVENFPFDDNHVPPLSLMKLFCENVRDWLAKDSRHVAVIHCKAGKGRTGLMISAYLVYKGVPVDEALQVYADRRTYNSEGVTIPSQRRYVGYWSKLLRFPGGPHSDAPEVLLPFQKRRELRRIRLYDVICTNCVRFVIAELNEVPGQLYSPAVEVAEGLCKLWEKDFCSTIPPRYYLSSLQREGENQAGEGGEARVIVQMDTERSMANKRCLDYYFEKPFTVAGDVRVIFYDMNGGHLFHSCFNSYFVSQSLLQLSRRELDKVGRRGRLICGPCFCVELLFGPVDPQLSLSAGEVQLL